MREIQIFYEKFCSSGDKIKAHISRASYKPFIYHACLISVIANLKLRH